MAAMRGNCEELTRILHGMKPTMIGAEGPQAQCRSLGTALMLAISKGWINIVKLLLEHVPYTDLYDKWHPLVLTVIDKGQFDMVEMFILRGVDFTPSSKFGNALHHAARAGNPRILSLVLHMECCDINKLSAVSASSPLHVAAQYSQTECARLLLDHGATVDELNGQHQTALHLAAIKGNRELLELLLLNGADATCVFLNGQNTTPWMYAIKHGHRVIAELLTSKEDLHKCYEIQNGQSLLHLACKSGSHECAVELLSEGANPGQWDNERYTPLYYAVKRRHVPLIRLLVKEPRCLINNKSSTGRTVLQALDESDNNFSLMTQHIYDMLHKAGADLNQPYSFSCTPLMANITNEKVARWLLEAGADPNVVVGQGNTAFFEAVDRSFAFDGQLLKTLMNANFNMKLTKLKDPNRDNGTTPLQSMLRCEFAGLSHFLIDVGCSINGIAEWLESDDSKDCRISSQMAPVLQRIKRRLLLGRVASLQDLTRTAILFTLGHLRVKQKIYKLQIPELLQDFLWWETYASMNRLSDQLELGV